MNDNGYPNNNNPYSRNNDYQNNPYNRNNNPYPQNNEYQDIPYEQKDNPYRQNDQYHESDPYSDPPYQDFQYDDAENPVWFDDDYYDETGPGPKKWMLPLILVLSVVLAVLVFFIVRAATKNKDNSSKVRFERKETFNTELESVSLPEFSNPGPETSRNQVTVSQLPSHSRRPGGYLPSLTTQTYTTATTSKREIRISEETTKPTTSATTTAAPTTAPTTTPGTTPGTTRTTAPATTPTTTSTTVPTTTTAPTTTTVPSTTPTTVPTAESTAEPTTERTDEPTTEPITEPTAEPTAEPTTEPTTDPTAKPTQPIEVDFPLPVPADDYPGLPAAVEANNKVAKANAASGKNAIVNAEGSEIISSPDPHTIVLVSNDEEASEQRIEDIENPVDKVVAANKKAIYYLSGTDLYRLNPETNSGELINNGMALNYSKTKFLMHKNGSMFMFDGKRLNRLNNEISEPALISESSSDAKLQGNLLAYLNSDKQVEYINLEKPNAEQAVQKLPVSNISEFALAADGSGIFYQTGNTVYAYKDGKIYTISENAQKFLLTYDANKVLIYTNKGELLLVQLGTEITLSAGYADVSEQAFEANRRINYSGNYFYADSQNIITEIEEPEPETEPDSETETEPET